MSLFNSADKIVFPKRCSCCNKIIPVKSGVCKSCFDELRNIANICNICGKELSECECKKRAFLFNGITAPFRNFGTAQNGVYGMKFLLRPYAGEFFGKRMYNCVVRDFGEVDFDYVVSVPMRKRSKIKRGYNHAELLALVISENLGVSYKKNLLVKCRDNSTQHNLNLKERVSNVSGAYKVSGPISGKTVLLVDDIKTTGATLNECSKQLLLSGATAVYCAVALTSGKPKNKHL